MKEEFEWKGEFTFKGSAEEFAKFAEVINGLLEAGTITCEAGDWIDWPGPYPGIPPWPIEELLGRKVINALIEGMPRFAMAYIDDIRGGMRTAHLHLQDDIVLLDRERFREFAKSVASVMVERQVDMGEDFVSVMGRFNVFAATPIEIP
jgi:hypothetical protein